MNFKTIGGVDVLATAQSKYLNKEKNEITVEQ